MTLTWRDPQDDTITGYQILRRDKDIHEEGTFETVEADTGTAETTYTDGSVEPERRYVYRIKAVNAHGLSEISSWVRAYTPAAPATETTPDPANSAATGAPAVTGTAQVGETLTADTSAISDADGLDDASFSYQWIADDTDIQGATGSTYTLVSEDEGKTLRVRVSFTDDTGNEESLTSPATAAVAAASSGEEDTQDGTEEVLVWSAEMTVEWVYRGYGYYSTASKKAGSLSPASFEVDDATYTLTMIETAGWMYIGLDAELPFDFVIEFDGERFASGDATFNAYNYGNIYEWRDAGLKWRNGDTVEVRLLRVGGDSE